MKRIIELKHVRAREHVRSLLEDLVDRLEGKLAHFPADAVSVHVVFEENGSRSLCRTSLSCHLPGHTVAAHEEHREPGASIRAAFHEVTRQLEKQKANVRHEHLLRRSKRQRRGARESGEPADALGGPA